MAKRALLIGVSQYQAGLGNLPATLNDIEAMRAVLSHPDLGSFDQVTSLPNPGLLQMQMAISELFEQGQEEDLLLLYFAGHGITDELGKFFFANCETRKNSNNRLIKGTAVAASLVHDLMQNSDCDRQVVILDCCHSGAFPKGMMARDGSGTIDFQSQLGGQGRIILTSSAATEYSFERKGEELAIYTRYLVEGIQTGAADLNGDGLISANELHDYVHREVRKAAPAMQPERYVFKDGEKIVLAKAAKNHLERLYRQEVEQRVKSSQISPSARRLLDRKRVQLGKELSPERADAIEQAVLKPYREYEQNLQEYEQTFAEELMFAYPFSPDTWQNLKDLQTELKLRDEDVLPIQTRLTQAAGFSLDRPEAIPPPASPTSSPSSPSPPLPTPSPPTPPSFPTFSFDVITLDAKGKETGRKPGTANYFSEDLGNGISLEMVQIPAGDFLMGTADAEWDRVIQEYSRYGLSKEEAEKWTEHQRPQHRVTVPEFWMGKFAVTQAQWQAIAALPKVKIDLKPDPANFKGPKRPVECVSWDEAVEFCARLSRKTGKPYRLPSEAEWEYACRAGTATPFHFGATITPELVNYDGNYPYANAPKGEYREKTIDVGSFPPNAFGLYDMHGNVWEWCQDPWHDSYQNATANEKSWEKNGDNNTRLLRGGSWGSNPVRCRSAYRNRSRRGNRGHSLGFRVVCLPPRTF